MGRRLQEKQHVHTADLSIYLCNYISIHTSIYLSVYVFHQTILSRLANERSGFATFVGRQNLSNVIYFKCDRSFLLMADVSHDCPPLTLSITKSRHHTKKRIIQPSTCGKNMYRQYSYVELDFLFLA